MYPSVREQESCSYGGLQYGMLSGVRRQSTARKVVAIGPGAGDRAGAIIPSRDRLIPDGWERRDGVRTGRMRTVEEVTVHGNEAYRH
jgi:hypothetical protein